MNERASQARQRRGAERAADERLREEGFELSEQPVSQSGGEEGTAGTGSAGHRVVIVGGGFGGLFAARALRRAPVQITLVDRAGHHLFQPLLYQTATGILSEGQIAAP